MPFSASLLRWWKWWSLWWWRLPSAGCHIMSTSLWPVSINVWSSGSTSSRFTCQCFGWPWAPPCIIPSSTAASTAGWYKKKTLNSTSKHLTSTLSHCLFLLQIQGWLQAGLPLLSLHPDVKLRRAGAPKHQTSAVSPEQHVYPVSSRHQHPEQKQEYLFPRKQVKGKLWAE